MPPVTSSSHPGALYAVATFAVLGCGSRTGVSLEETTRVPIQDASVAHPVDASLPPVTDARSPPHVDATSHDSDTPHDAEADVARSAEAGRFYVCPSDVLSGSPLPMLNNCSTRDGRARVAGPTAPHLTWTVPAPAGLSNGGFVAADGTGGVYIADAPLVGNDMIPTFGRVNGTTGALDWSTALPASTVASLSPFLAPTGSVVDFANDPTGPILESFNPMTGAVVATMLSPSLAGIGIPAVGSEGSLYVQYVPSTGLESKAGYVSRVLPNSTIAWTSADLSGGPSSFGGFLTLALSEHDDVIAVTTDTSSVLSGVYELSSTTGATVWTTDIAAQAIGGPAVGPDGSIAVIAISAGGSTGALYIFEPTGALRAMTPVDGANIYAIGTDGTIIVGGATLTAFTSSGTLLWTNAVVPLGATIDSGGTVVTTFSDVIQGLDGATGAVRWSLKAPDLPDGGSPCAHIQSVTLTSNATLVGIGCNALFGASD